MNTQKRSNTRALADAIAEVLLLLLDFYVFMWKVIIN